MKYKLELWNNMERKNIFETNDFDAAKEQFLNWRKEYDENMEGVTDFQIDGQSMSLEWKYEHLLGLDFKKIIEEQQKKVQEILNDIHK